jgi:hypothetical protein
MKKAITTFSVQLLYTYDLLKPGQFSKFEHRSALAHQQAAELSLEFRNSDRN